jgi:hypothetical protein
MTERASLDEALDHLERLVAGDFEMRHPVGSGYRNGVLVDKETQRRHDYAAIRSYIRAIRVLRRQREWERQVETILDMIYGLNE